jgi:putative membrane protein
MAGDVPEGRLTLSTAWQATPGPRGWEEGLRLWAKGLCMGAADIVPGVSGGTIAFITGIYGDLVEAIKSVDHHVLGHLLRGDLPGALARVHLRFLATLFLGIGTSLVIGAHVVNFLLAAHPVELWSFFFGLIAASVLMVAARVARWTPAALAALVSSTASAWLIVGLIPVETPNTWWFLFLSGAVAICAMILPGISGAFLLLVLGKYTLVTGALRNPFDPGNIAIMAIFAAGCLAGITGFSRLLSVLLHRFHTVTVAGLTGFVLGAMRKVWPWKEAAEVRVVDGHETVVAAVNVLPDGLDAGVGVALGLMAFGFALILVLDWLSRCKDPGRS